MSSPIVRRFRATLFPVNAYLVDVPDGVVAVDSTLGVTDGRALQALVASAGKRLLAVLITHAHPDHYGALTALLDGADVPIIATAGVSDVIRRDDPAKEQILRPMFGEEWAHQRTFPNRRVRDGERLTFGDAAFRVVDLGPGESPHDSMFVLESDGPPQAFVGDLVYNRMHAYLADGFHDAWLSNLARARRELLPGTIRYPGHGEPGPAAPLIDWQETYIRTFIDAVRAVEAEQPPDEAAFKEAVTARMHAYLPTDDLLFLMQLSIAPMRDWLAHE